MSYVICELDFGTLGQPTGLASGQSETFSTRVLARVSCHSVVRVNQTLLRLLQKRKISFSPLIINVETCSAFSWTSGVDLAVLLFSSSRRQLRLHRKLYSVVFSNGRDSRCASFVLVLGVLFFGCSGNIVRLFVPLGISPMGNSSRFPCESRLLQSRAAKTSD